jgi:hypothetical protein
VESVTEHEVWNEKLAPLPSRTSLLASNDPAMVNVFPSDTCLVWPFIVTDVEAGKVPVSWPYALDPCWF